MASNIVLVTGPFVRASSWESTAHYLQELGYKTQAPDVLADQIRPSSWSEWPSCLMRHISSCESLNLVGHSSAGPLVADLASRLPCRSIIIVDGHVPPSQGLAAPVRPALREFIKSLQASEGLLPIWSRWFSNDVKRKAVIGLDRLASNPSAFSKFEGELRSFPADWIDDVIELKNWDHVPAGFIQTCELYDYAADEARLRGWPVTKLQGTHLHPILEPAETADAINSMIRQLTAASAR